MSRISLPARPALASRALVPAALVLSLVVAGCGTEPQSSPTAEGSAQAECDSVTADLQKIGDELATLSDKIPGDVPGALAIVSSVSGQVGGLAGRVSDPELRTRLTTLADELAQLQDRLAAAAGDPIGSAGDLLDALSRTGTAYTSLKGYCGFS